MRKFEIETTEQLLSLMNLYYSEWQHRDSLMWKKMCTFFFAVFIVILLPFANIWDISLATKIPNYIFPITGILISFVFLHICMQYAERLSKIGETYRALIELLPEDYRRKSIHRQEEIVEKRKQMAYTVPVMLFLALIIFGIVILVVCLV